MNDTSLLLHALNKLSEVSGKTVEKSTIKSPWREFSKIPSVAKITSSTSFGPGSTVKMVDAFFITSAFEFAIEHSKSENLSYLSLLIS